MAPRGRGPPGGTQSAGTAVLGWGPVGQGEGPEMGVSFLGSVSPEQGRETCSEKPGGAAGLHPSLPQTKCLHSPH